MPQPPVHTQSSLSFIELQSIDSTNNYARLQIHAGLAREGTCIFTHEQTAGKGQRGKSWIADSDANILMTLVLQPNFLTVHRQFELSACIATATHRFFTKYAGDETRIKWPNDLYWQDRKAGGMLIENIIKTKLHEGVSWEWSIVGIGININQTVFPESLVNPVSLKQITGKNFDPNLLVMELANGIYEQYLSLKLNGFDSIYAEYLEHLYKKNESVTLKKDTRTFDAVIKSVSPSGKLIVAHAIEEEFDFGDIVWCW